MREFIGLLVGLYLTVALVVFGGAAYGFMAGESPQYSSCAAAGGNKWVPWAIYRAAAWPKTWFDDQDKASGLADWLLVHYDPEGACG
jgi:hypothetical protein